MPYRTIMAEHRNVSVQGIDIPKNRIVIAEQTHSNHVHICNQSDGGAGFDEHCQIPECDALVTNQPDLFLLIRTADCTPILLYDKITHSVGGVHSGREGTRKNIAGETIKVMNGSYGSNPENIQAWIGAGICKTHYKVSDTTWQDFFQSCKQHNIHLRESDFPCLDLQSVICEQLLMAGLCTENIECTQTCTYESQNHFSFRRDGTHNRQINLIGLIYGKHNL